MKKFGWGILFVFMLLLVWNTRVAKPNNAEAVGFDLWALFVISLTFVAGWKLWFLIFPKRAPLPAPTPLNTTRLSETKEIQEAFQREMIALFNEAGASENLPLIQTPANVKEILDGEALLDNLERLEKRGSLQTLGFKPEQIR
ncbi:MAG TPA: hypothetical protein VJQ59_09235, partial [Candidatus Sulfotelmatobacter sp.]|nr:hypothetical protein [Candidatus Sulfotelmatobacter sp.]